MKRRSATAVCLAVLVATGAGAPAARAQDAPAGLAAPAGQAGVVLLIEGVGGIHLMQLAGDLGLRRGAGLPHEVRQFYWSHGFGRLLRDLQDVRHVLAKAQELADEVRALKRREPERRVFLVAHSGGTGIAVRAAELLPPDTLERVVLLSSALSPDYDLRPALAACRQGIVSYYSANDFFVLGWGTSHFGTINREYRPSAGYEGFHVPPGLDPADQALYGRLVQVPWSARMIRHGYWGTHNGTVQPSFLAAEVAQWLR